MSQDQIVDDDLLYEAFAHMRNKDFKKAESCLLSGLKKAEDTKNKNLEGIYHSSFGVFYKAQGQFKKAFKSYQKAEKLLPDDPHLKIILGHLLIEEFSEYESAARRMQKVIESTQDLLVIHHALAVLGRALLLSGDHGAAEQCLKALSETDVSFFKSASQMDFKFAELVAKKNLWPQHLKAYLSKAESVAKAFNEVAYQKIIEGLQLLLIGS